MAGQWSCDDLVGLVRLLLRNRPIIDRLDSGLTGLGMPLRRIRHWFNRNSRAGSRRNIAAHYDLGNDFYRLWLDPTMMYSCALYERADMNLHEASVAKLEHICSTLDLRRDDHVLEIGTGWGGFALHAASCHGCRVTTVTLSQEQHDLATERIREAGLDDRVEVRLCDYRDLDGQYDKLVSIEMIEAVGAANLGTYFRQCGRLLKPDGTVMYHHGTFDNLVVTHPSTGVYCLGAASGTSIGLGNYDPVLATAHGQDFAKVVATVNTEYGSTCNPYGGHGVFTTNLAGTATDAYVVVALM